MRTTSTLVSALAGVAILSLLPSQAQAQTYKDAVGFTSLSLELGAAMPKGANVAVSYAEADFDGVGGAPYRYMPDINNGQFVGKSFTAKSPNADTTASGHATTVGQYFFGATSSLAPSISTVDVYEAGHFLGSGFLRLGSTAEPVVETRKVQNHSWIHTYGNSNDLDALRRLDFAIVRDGFTAVVGLNNGTGAHPALLSQGYNAIAVGRTDGNHSRGFTTVDGSGRVKPDIVAPMNATSYSTPLVGSAAALLHDKIATTPALSNAAKPQVIKSLLMAGATKNEFVTWNRTTTRPLDSVYGAGELNIHRSYHILTAGEQEPGIVSLRGWDSNTISTTTRLYYFDVPELHELTELSVMLNWNRIVVDGVAGANFGNLSSSLADLNLALYRANDLTLGDLVDASSSAVDNVEHIYQLNLDAGRYALQVSSLSPSLTTDYALSWYGGELIAIPEPTAAVVVFAAMLFARRRREPMTA